MNSLIRQRGIDALHLSFFLSFFFFFNEYFSRAVCEVPLDRERKEEKRIISTGSPVCVFHFHLSSSLLSSTTWPEFFCSPALPIRSPRCCRFTSCRTNSVMPSLTLVNANVHFKAGFCARIIPFLFALSLTFCYFLS